VTGAICRRRRFATVVAVSVIVGVVAVSVIVGVVAVSVIVGVVAVRGDC
jgi:hypothetical protein